MADNFHFENAVFIVDLSGSMTEGAKLHTVGNLMTGALQSAASGFGLRIVYVSKQLEEFAVGEDRRIPTAGFCGGALNENALKDYLTRHAGPQDILFLFSDTAQDIPRQENLFTILVGDETAPDKIAGNTFHAETFPALWQTVIEAQAGNRP